MKTIRLIYLKNPFRRVTALILAAVMLLGLVPVQGQSLLGVQTVKAAEMSLSNPRTTVDGATIWDCIYFGNYIQSNEMGAEPEPIKWRVLSVDENSAFLLADKNLEIKQYNDVHQKVTWEECTLRKWLNEDFLDAAFTEEEQVAIQETEVVNDDNQDVYEGGNGGNDTKDKIYLLSIWEAMNTDYGFTSTSDNTDTRKASDTSYLVKYNAGFGSEKVWWLRTSGFLNTQAVTVRANGEVPSNGQSVADGFPAVRPVLHINLESDSKWEYAGTVDSAGNVTKPEPSINVGVQTGTVTYGVDGSSTYEIKGKNFDDTVFSPNVVWMDNAPEGIESAFSENNTQLTLTTSIGTNAGTYRFRVTSGDTVSEVATLLVNKADVFSIITEVSPVSMTAYEARGSESKDAVITLANLPSEVVASLSGGGTATLPIIWTTNTEYNAKGEVYTVTGTLTENDNISVENVTTSVKVTVTPINVIKPTFADISVYKDVDKSAATATDLGNDVLPDGGTVTVEVGGGKAESVDYAIEWNRTETLNLTEVGNNTTFTGEINYPSAPAWLTLPTNNVVTREVTVKEKTHTTVTVTAPDSITYGENLGNPSAVTSDTLTDAAFTYQYNGILYDEYGTQYNSTNKPTQPGSYTVTAILVSVSHMGTSESEDFIIHKKDLTWATSGVADSKTYDGTAAATASTQPALGGVIDEDDVKVGVGGLTFASVNAGEDIPVTARGYGIAGTDAWKYNAPSVQPDFGSGTITPKNTTLTVEPIGSLDYTGSVLTPTLVVKDESTTLTLEDDYHAAYSGNTNAGTASVTVTGKGNYEGSTGSASFTINKVDYAGKKTVNKNVLSDTAATGVTVILPDLPDGVGYGTASVATANGLVTGTPSVDGAMLTFNVASKADGVVDTITVPVTGATNYNDYAVTVTVNAIAVSATLSGSVMGYGGVALTGTQGVTVTLDGDDFVGALGGDWITNLPAGLTQTVTRVDDSTARINVSGTPAETSDTQIDVTIPSGSLVVHNNASIVATTSEDAKYDIINATYTLAFDGDPGSFTELTYGYDAGSSVTYTIKNTGNQTLDNIKAAIREGGGYFTTGSPGAATLAPNETTTVTVTSKTGLGASETAYGGTLNITWTGGDGQTGMEQVLSQKVNKANQATLRVIGLDNAYEIGVEPVTLGTSGGSGTGAVTYVTSDPAVASIDGNRLTIHKMADFTVTATKAGDSNYNEVSSAAFTVTVTDDTAPTGVIKIKNNGWKQFLNTVTFGLFFKDKVDVAITAEDNSGEEVTVEYYLSNTELTKEEAKEATDWTTGKSFHMEANNRYIIYARLTDATGNVTIINSEGVVVYSDSSADTAEINHIKFTGDKTAAVTLNGNAINKITNGATTLEENEDYTVNGNLITFKQDYLDSLTVGGHPLSVHYNPMGLTYVDGDDNEPPEATEIMLTVSKAAASAITTVVDNVRITAYEAKDATTREAVVILANLPSTVEVSLNDGGTTTLGMAWATSTAYNAKGTVYDVIGTLVGNEDVDAGSITKQLIVEVVPIHATNPSFDDAFVFINAAKPAAAAADLGTEVLPDGGTVAVDVGGGVKESVNYTIAWGDVETLNMTEAGNHTTFTGVVGYVDAPTWLTLPDATVSRKVTVKDKMPATVTVTAPDSIAYGGDLGNPSADTSDTVDDAGFTYQYRGTLSDGGSTPYNSTDKPTEPGYYSVTATLVSDTHIGTSEPAGFTIHKKDLTWATAGTVSSKTYDGKEDATAATQPALSGVINGDAVEVQNGTVRFVSVDAGSGVTVTANGYGVTGTHVWKYNAPSDQPAFAKGTIHPKKTNFTVEPIADQTYTGNKLTPAVVVKDGTTALTLDREYTVSYSNNTNAGTAAVTIAGKGNYQGSTGGAEFTINKTTYTGMTTAAKNVLSNTAANGVGVRLPNLPDGASYGTARITTQNGLVTGNLSVTGITLTFNVAPKENGTTETISIPVTGAMNYMDYDVEVTITAVSKKPVTIGGINVEDKTYDGTAVTRSGTPVANDGTSNVDVGEYEYMWQNAGGDVLTEAPKDAGSYKLVVSVSDNNADYVGSREINFTIHKAAITITADNKTATVGDPVPVYTYTVHGLAPGEVLKTYPTLSCTLDMNTAGTYAITPSGAEVPDGGNYKTAITYVDGTLTLRTVQEANVTVSFHSNGGDDFIAVTDITDIPTKATVGAILGLKGTVWPEGAANRAIQWTVKSKGTTGAKITNGRLKTTGSGTAIITATIQNGNTGSADYTKDFTIKVSYPVKKGRTYTVSGYKYKVTSIKNSKKTASFVGLTAAKKKKATKVNIKKTVKIKGISMKITAVGKKALKGNKKVRRIKIGNNVQSIGYAAFSKCTALKNVTIGTGLKTINKHAFCQDSRLRSITIRSTKLKSVKGKHVFAKVKATIKVPASKMSAYRKRLKGKSGSIQVKK